MEKKRIKKCDAINQFRNLNLACLELEKKVKKEIVNLNKNLLYRVKDKHDFLHDFCIEILFQFILSEEDPEWVLESDNEVGSVNIFGNFFYPYEKQNGQWQHLADGRNWNLLGNCSWYPLKNEHHCFLLSQLFRNISPEKLNLIVRIGSISVDINVCIEHIKYLDSKKSFRTPKKKWPDIQVEKFV